MVTSIEPVTIIITHTHNPVSRVPWINTLTTTKYYQTHRRNKRKLYQYFSWEWEPNLRPLRAVRHSIRSNMEAVSLKNGEIANVTTWNDLQMSRSKDIMMPKRLSFYSNIVLAYWKNVPSFVAQIQSKFVYTKKEWRHESQGSTRHE